MVSTPKVRKLVGVIQMEFTPSSLGGGCRRCGSKLHHMQECTRSRREAEAAAEGTAEAAAGGGKRIRLPMASAATSADAEDDEAFYALERASDDEEEELKKEIPISRPLPAKVAKTSRQVKIVKF